jgi:hypothetical protein
MSFLSRLFRKTPSVPASTGPASAPSAADEKSVPKSGAAERARVAAAETIALQSAIEAGDVQAVAGLVVAGASTQVRQAAASAIEDPDVLRRLIRDVRGGNDKHVYKILTTKREVLLERTRERERLQAEIDAAAEAIERHGKRAYDALYVSRLDECERRWAVLATQASPERRDGVQRWIDRCRETIAGHERQVAAEAARDQAEAEAAAAAQRLREEQAQASAAAAAEQARVVEEQRRAAAEKQQAEQQAIRDIADLIRKARATLGGGSTSRAAALRRTLEEKLAQAPPLPAHVAGQIQHLDKQLDELKDWKTFSVTPKRAELIEEMESLVGETSDDPLALAERIKALQDQWRTLGKGAGENAEADSQRFQDAFQKAYQPCREYFAAQARVREENLRRRDALLATLTAFESETRWEQPDWQAVINVLRETKQAWRRCAPVDPQAARPQQEAFAARVAGLQERLDAEYDRNVKQKESLIERARELLASDDGRKAIDAIKGLQQQWRTVGPVPRDVDQRLWAEFRQHGDAVFQKRQQASAVHAAGLENNKAQAVGLCEQIETIAALEGPELLARAGSLADFRKAFDAIGEFPRADTRSLRDRLERGLDRCRKSIARQHARDAERGWDDLLEAAHHVRAYQLAAVRGMEPSRVDSLKTAAETFIASVPRWPNGALGVLKQGLARDLPADLAANEAALRMLCVRAEIRTDLPTPAEDQSLRRDYQLQRLVQRMGRGVTDDEAQMDAMVIEWASVGPVEEAPYESLLRRFRRCRERDISKLD